MKENAKVKKKECKEIYRRESPDQNKRPFSKGPSFSKQDGGDSQYLQKSLITNGKVVVVKGIKTEDSLARKHNKKATFFNKNIAQLKKNSKGEIYIKETVPLPLSGGSLPEIVSLHQLREIHPLVRNLFPNVKVSNFPLAGRLQYFVKHWKKLTSNPQILEWVSGLKIDFILEPFQEKVPHHQKLSAQESLLVTKKVESMLRKVAIQKTSVKRGQFLSNLFLVGKKDRENRPVINLKMNAFIPYLHLKMEGLHLLKDMLKEKEYMCKIDLKDAYFCVPLHQKHRKYIRFCWEGQLYEFFCLCFGLGLAPRIFTKLLKIPIATLRRINIRILVYLDDMLLMSQTIGGLNMARDTLIFLLQQLGFIITLKKSVLSATQK